MTDQPQSDPLASTEDLATGPGPPSIVNSANQALTASLPGVPAIHLRDPRDDALAPIVRTRSDNMPRGQDLEGRCTARLPGVAWEPSCKDATPTWGATSP